MNEHQELAIAALKRMRPVGYVSATHAALNNVGQGEPSIPWWEKENAEIDAAIVWIMEAK